MNAADADDAAVIGWLLGGDPAIRWQTLRDLCDAAPTDTAPERARVANEGWGAALLKLQQADGTWPSEYHPDVYRGRPTSRHYLYKPEGTSTFHSLALLAHFGLEPTNDAAGRACRLVLDAAMRNDGGLAVTHDAAANSEMCQTGWGLALLSYFGTDDDRLDTIATHLLENQMDDGGWNCQQRDGARHASMHTTILALEGLAAYAANRAEEVDVSEARAAGEEFLLRHQLLRSCRTGEFIEPKTHHSDVDWPPFTTIVFPPHWHYDVLRALEHFRAVDAPRDDRLVEGVEIVRAARQASGRWHVDHRWLPTAIDIEVVGGPSRWNTLRAMRVLRWWDTR